MTDESNGESGFEFVEKKLEDFSNTVVIEAPKVDDIETLTTAALDTKTSLISKTASNILNIAPPSALPTFITNESQELIKSESVKPPIQLPQNIQAAEPSTSKSSDNMKHVLIAPDSPIKDTGVLVGSLFSWVKDTVANSNVLSKVAEKAKNSVNSMITTLDPQMREFIYSGGDIEIVVASENDTEVAPVREAFQNVFGNATVTGIKIEKKGPHLADCPINKLIGFEYGIRKTKEKIAEARSNPSTPTNIPVIAVESFIFNVYEDVWFDLSIIVLEDIKQGINLQTATQMTPVPTKMVNTVIQSKHHYHYDESFSASIDSLMGENLQVPHTEWHKALTGVSKKDIIFSAAQSLAGIYKNIINPV